MGKTVVNGLRATGKYEVVSAAHHPRAGTDDVALEVTSLESCIEVLKGADVVVHMAFWLGEERKDFVTKGIPTNVIGTFHIYEAARINQVKRVIFCSSNHVYGFYPADAMVGDYAQYRPDSVYGLCKCYAELLGRYYSDRFGISSINLRVGHCQGDVTDYEPGVREYKQWLSNRDLVQLTEKCIEAAPELLYRNYPGISNNEDFWDLTNARKELGYEPMDDGRDLITERAARNETKFKGGDFLFF